MATIEDMCPKCCYTCFAIQGGVTCGTFGIVPLEFMKTVDACPEWNRSAF